MSEPARRSPGARPPASVREVTADADLETLAAIVNEVTPDDPTSLAEMRWSDAVYPGARRFLAEAGGRAVGMATVGRIFVYPPDHPDAWANVVVLPDARRRGIGQALLVAASEVARAAGKSGLHLRASEGRPEGIAFLEHFGFVEIERARMLELPLAGLAAPRLEVPGGIALTSLAARPDLITGVHELALEAFADIRGGDTPMAVGDLAEFRARDVDRPGIPPEAFMLAVDRATDEVVGYASLMFVPASTTVAWHDMTAVRRAWRGQGLATLLKRATIDWAIREGLVALVTGNDEDNAPMRAVNARLGYLPLPDEVFLRGPLVSERA